MDTLQELPLDQWPLLKEKMKTLWPLNIAGYYALDTNIKHPTIREAFKFKIYCPDGDFNSGFIAISVKNGEEYIVFSIDEDTNKLEQALANTKLIDWNSKVAIGIAPSLTIRLMEKLKTRLELKKIEVWDAKMIYLDKTSKPFDVECPPDTYLAAVNPDDIKQVDDVWRFRYPASQFYFSTLISNDLSYGLYSLDKKLLAWIFLNEYNFLCHFYCEQNHRRKGYGEFLLKSVVNKCLEQGTDVYGYVVPGNEKAMELFTKLGFQQIDDSAWMNVGK